MKKYLLCICMILVSSQLHGMAGLRGYGSRIGAYVAQKFNNPQMPYAAINRYAQSLRQTTRLYTPKPTSPKDQTSYWAALKNAFSTMQRQASTTWSRHRTPITLSTLGVTGTGLAYRDDSIQNILGAQAISAEEVMRERLSQEEFDNYVKRLKSRFLDDKEKRAIEERLHETLNDYAKQLALEYGNLDDTEKYTIWRSLISLSIAYKELGASVGEAARDHLAKLMCKQLNIQLDNEQIDAAKMLDHLHQSSRDPVKDLMHDLIRRHTGIITTTNAAGSNHIDSKGYFFIPRCFANLLIEIGKNAELKRRATQVITEYPEGVSDPRNIVNLESEISILKAMQKIIDGKYSITEEDYIICRISPEEQQNGVPLLDRQYMTLKNNRSYGKFYNICRIFPEEQQNEVPLLDRQYMTLNDDNYGKFKVEGYWASDEDPSKDSYKGKYPFPKANPKPWPTQKEFLERLERLTEKAKLEKAKSVALGTQYDNNWSGYSVINWRGVSISRFEPSKYVGSQDYVYKDPKTGEEIYWTEAFGPYYVKKFNVKPSKEFYDWVMNNPDADFGS